MNTYSIWFGRVVWLGIFANLLIAIPALLLPGETLVLFAFPSAYPLLWVTVSALFLILLSLLEFTWWQAATTSGATSATLSSGFLADGSRTAGRCCFLPWIQSRLLCARIV